MTASLLASTIAVSLTPTGPIKDAVLALALSLSVAAGAERGVSAARASAGAVQPSSSSSTSTGSSRAVAGQANSSASLTPPLGPASVAAATTLSIVLVAMLFWLDSSTAPHVYIIVAGGASFFATFRPVFSRCMIAAGAKSSMSSILCLLFTLGLMAALQFLPDYVCGESILYVCFVSQVVQAVPLDSVAVSMVLNVVSMAVELLAATGLLQISGIAVGSGGEDGVFGDSETIIWRSLKDLAVVGTLFPALLAFDGDSGSRQSSRRYFYTALAVLFCCLLAVGLGGVGAPLCYLSTPSVICALSVQAFTQAELSALLGYRISSSVNVKKK